MRIKCESPSFYMSLYYVAFFKFLLAYGCKSGVLASGRHRAEAASWQFNVSPCGQGLWDLKLLLLYSI